MAVKASSKASSPIQAVLGSDDAEVKRVARELANRMTPASGGDFACDTIEGQVSNASEAATRVHQAVEALQTFPFFGGEKLVWLKNANFLGDTVTSKASETLEALVGLQQLLEKGLPEGIRFLLSATEFDKRRAFSKALVGFATVQTFDHMDTSRAGWEEKAMVLVREQAELVGLRLDGAALELLAVRTGGERRTILSELEKISLYLGGVGAVGHGRRCAFARADERDRRCFRAGERVGGQKHRRSARAAGVAGAPEGRFTD